MEPKKVTKEELAKANQGHVYLRQSRCGRNVSERIGERNLKAAKSLPSYEIELVPKGQIHHEEVLEFIGKKYSYYIKVQIMAGTLRALNKRGLKVFNEIKNFLDLNNYESIVASNRFLIKANEEIRKENVIDAGKEGKTLPAEDAIILADDNPKALGE